MCHPLHRIQVRQCLGFFYSANASQEWTGTFFRKSTLRALGHKVQLGHQPGDTCTSPQRSTRPFTVLHTNGIHQIDIWFCGCDLAALHGDRVQQLLWRRLFPATSTDPQTGSTFALLEYAHVLSVQSKLSLYDFYLSIEIITDATRVSGVKVRLALIIPHPKSYLTFTKGPLSGVSPDDQDVAPPAPLETRRESSRPNRCPGYCSWRACSIVPSMSLSRYQPPSRLEVGSKPVCSTFYFIGLGIHALLGIFIIGTSALTLVSVSKDGKYQATRGILS